MRYLVTVFLNTLLVSTTLWASEKQCGEYQVEGIIEKQSENYFFIVHRSSASEQKIEIDDRLHAAMSYLDHVILGGRALASVDQDKKIVIYGLSELNPVMKNPLASTDKFEFNKEVKCK